MRIAITGAAGFIGANAAKFAIAAGHDVIGYDNLYTGTRANLASIGKARFEFVEHDVRQPFPNHRPDLILHLACPASPVHYQRDPMFTWETSVFGTKHVVDFAYAAKIPVLIASTSEVYGDPKVSPQNESYWGHVNCVGERSCYDEGKRAAETYANDMRRVRGADVRIIRIFNTYGPLMCADDGRVVSNFIVQALRGEPVTVYGDGLQTRSFCYVDDLVRGIFAMALHPQPIPFPVNLGNPDERTILQLIEVIEACFGRKLQQVRKPLPSDDPLQRRPDITRAKTLLGWEPQVPVQQGIARTIDYFKAALGQGA